MHVSNANLSSGPVFLLSRRIASRRSAGLGRAFSRPVLALLIRLRWSRRVLLCSQRRYDIVPTQTHGCVEVGIWRIYPIAIGSRLRGCNTVINFLLSHRRTCDQEFYFFRSRCFSCSWKFEIERAVPLFYDAHASSGWPRFARFARFTRDLENIRI